MDRDDDLDILNDADELALFEKLDLIAAEQEEGEEGEEEEELLVIPKSKGSQAAQQPKTSFNTIRRTADSPQFETTDDDLQRTDYSSDYAGRSPTRGQSDNEHNNNLDRSNSPSSKRAVSFRQLEGMHYYQDRNRALIRAQANFLHPRAVLFVGSVLSVTLPAVAPFDADDCELLYRVLFIEGGSQPAMFRCKTPIFTSSSATLLHQIASWEDHTFRFDMLMPDAELGEDPHYLNIQGEVMLSLYRKKPNGGNDVVAQFSVDLQRMKLRGSKEIFEKDHSDAGAHKDEPLEGRSMNGIFPLQLIQSSTGRKTEDKDTDDNNHGEIEIQFNIAWHRDDPRGEFAGGDGASIGGEQHSVSHRSRSATSRSVKAPVTGRSSQKTGSTVGPRPKSATATAPSSATMKKAAQASATNQYKYEQPRKIVSKLDRQRKEMDRKIARENQLLHSRIAKHVPDQGPNKSQASATLSQNKVTAYQNYDAVLSTVRKGNANNNENPRIVSIPPDVLEKDTTQWRQYQQLFESLKKEIRDEENNVKDLRAKLSNINTQIQRQEAGMEKVKLLTAAAVGTSRHASQTLSADAKEASHAPPSTSSVRSSRESLVESGRAPTGDEDASNVELGAWSQLSYMPGGLENVQDGEYRQLADEFQVLQRLRRSLLERIAEARKHSGSATIQQQDIDEKVTIVRQRLWHLKQHHGEDFGAVVMMKDPPSSTKRLADAKLDGEDELTIYDRLLSVRTEITSIQTQGGFTLSAIGEEVVTVPSGPAHPEILALQSTRNELESMLYKLDTHVSRAEVEVARLNQEQREKMSLVSDVASQHEWIERRGFIADMRAMEMRLKREERLQALSQASKDLELQMIHYRMVIKEREELRTQKEELDHLQEEKRKLLGTTSRPQSPSPTTHNA